MKSNTSSFQAASAPVYSPLTAYLSQPKKAKCITQAKAKALAKSLKKDGTPDRTERGRSPTQKQLIWSNLMSPLPSPTACKSGVQIQHNEYIAR